MSKKSSTPVIAYPYKMAEVELKSLKVRATDVSSNPLEHYDIDWKLADQDKPRRIDFRDKYVRYGEDELYSEINELKISAIFDVNTKDCLQSGYKYIAGVHLKSSMSRYEKYEALDEKPREKKKPSKISVELTLDKQAVQKLRGNIIISPIVILASDKIGTPPEKAGSNVFATAKGSILSARQSTNQFTIVFDDPGPPTSSGMEIVWLDMKPQKNALYSLSYPENIAVDEPIHVRLVLNEDSALYSLSKVKKGARQSKKKALKDLILTEIVCDVKVNLLSDLVRFFRDEMSECIDGTREPDPDSALEYAMDVLGTISEQTDYTDEEILNILSKTGAKNIEDITIRLQHSKKHKLMLKRVYQYLI